MKDTLIRRGARWREGAMLKAQKEAGNMMIMVIVMINITIVLMMIKRSTQINEHKHKMN